MSQIWTRRAAAVLVCLLALGMAGALAQNSAAQNSPVQDQSTQGQSTPATQPGSTSKPKKNVPAPATPAQPNSGGDANAFPEDVSRQAAQQGKSSDAGSTPGNAPNAPAAKDSPDAPDSSAVPNPPPAGQQAKPPSAAQDNPFPEDVSRDAAKAAAGESSAAPSGVSSSSSSSSYEPDVDPHDSDAGRHRLPKPSKNLEAGSLSAVARAKQDIQIGNFYLGTGDNKGAYARFADAGKMDPTNVDAIFGLAQAARGLQHTQEAITNYQMFLAIEPDSARAKAARKALSGLEDTAKAGSAKNDLGKPPAK